ncbi:MAG: TCR/Tet family MFS transporter, partial [Rhizobiales bacterium]|nr:TCR/Tet family MFS transporter [Hyphomicrobiales bacterium]
DITGTADIAALVGVVAALYAAMQFVFAPVLGALSDRVGRRPVLLVSLAGAVASYLFLAVAPTLWMLLIGRAVAGMTSASVSVASAYVTDITPPEKRARRFGLLNAMFGLGFIVGPVLGGLLGDHWLRLPFVVAALLNGGNFLIALLVLPESRTPEGGRIDLAALNPLRPFRWAVTLDGLRPIITVVFLLSATGEAYGVCWALWGGDVFGWDGLRIGLSLATFGLCQALVQALLPGPAARLLGETGAILLGIAGVSAALVVMAFTTEGWLVFAVVPVFALGGIGVPALQSLATRRVDDSLQGRFQGVVASTVSLASIVAPLGFSSLYVLARQAWPGAIWLSVVALYAIAVPFVLGLRTRKTAPAAGPSSPSP